MVTTPLILLSLGVPDSVLVASVRGCRILRRSHSLALHRVSQHQPNLRQEISHHYGTRY